MPKQPTTYYRPRSVDEALRLLQQPNTVPLAGGTALLATEEGLDSAVVDLQDAGLNTLSWADDGRLLRLGAMVRLADLHDFLTPLTRHEGGAALLVMPSTAPAPTPTATRPPSAASSPRACPTASCWPRCWRWARPSACACPRRRRSAWPPGWPTTTGRRG
ncbi:MAG: FAD binding domain-containing protein [Candidatus Promineofilum sp.]|nr:FAD binding domain-containing protein [Promineifilum sp.]